MFWEVVKGTLALTIFLIVWYRLLIPIMEYRRLKAQGVVFNSRRFPLFDDVVALFELGAKDPYIA
jgi:hypothetical protein